MAVTSARTGFDASWLALSAAAGFVIGMLVMAALVTMFPAGAAVVTQPLVEAAPSLAVDVKPTQADEPAPVTPAPLSTPAMTATALNELRSRRLTLPVKGIKPADLRSNFDDRRGESRRHEALDVLAPRNTPVLAVEDGTVARLFLSDAGGITIYQFDPSATYVYYYAHLERYAEGLKEGAAIKRGQVVGYVGTTGNAPRDTPHLHFAIFKMTSEKKWWQGSAIDPYSVLK